MGEAKETKIVEYTWQWDLSAVPDQLKRSIPTLRVRHEEKATFRLYDDGWRSEIEIK